MRNITRRMMTLVLAIVTLVGAVTVNPSTTEAASKKWVSSISHTKITHNDNTDVYFIVEVKKDCKIINIPLYLVEYIMTNFKDITDPSIGNPDLERIPEETKKSFGEDPRLNTEFDPQKI